MKNSSSIRRLFLVMILCAVSFGVIASGPYYGGASKNIDDDGWTARVIDMSTGERVWSQTGFKNPKKAVKKGKKEAKKKNEAEGHEDPFSSEVVAEGCPSFLHLC